MSLTTDTEQLSDFWIEFAQKVLENPQKIVEEQLNHCQQYLEICKRLALI